MTRRERIIQMLQQAAMIALAILGARYGIPVPPPQIVWPENPAPNPPGVPPRPTEPQPDPWNAIVRTSTGNVGCSATVIGPRRADGRWWVLTAAHCADRVGQRWSMRFRDGRSGGFTIVSMNKTADYAWGVSDAEGTDYPFALLADSSPQVGAGVWHGGYGVDVPGNKELGQIRGAPDSNGQLRFQISVSSGDSGGGIMHDGAGRVLSPVCCTARRGAVSDVWGASPEACRAGMRDAVFVDQWVPMEVPIREVPSPMPARK